MEKEGRAPVTAHKKRDVHRSFIDSDPTVSTPFACGRLREAGNPLSFAPTRQTQRLNPLWLWLKSVFTWLSDFFPSFRHNTALLCPTALPLFHLYLLTIAQIFPSNKDHCPSSLVSVAVPPLPLPSPSRFFFTISSEIYLP